MQRTPSTFGNSKIARNAVFGSVATVLRASTELVDEHDRLDKMMMRMQEPGSEGVAESWTQGVNKSARLLKIGAETAIRNVKRVVGADVEEDGIEDSTLVEDGETLEALEQMELNYELYRGLLFAEYGVKKMVKGLPEPEED